MNILLSLVFSYLLAAAAYAAPQLNLPTTVNLRIEGKDSTIYEGPIITEGHDVTTASGGRHHCDGTNNEANETPGPTCTSALDTASKFAKFPWDATFLTAFDDFFITSIGDSTQTSTQVWAVLLNYQLTPVGGCQQQVKLSDEVLWAFDALNKAHYLKLTGPAFAHAHSTVILTVTDGSTGSPVSGASVGEQTSDANGHVSVTLGGAGSSNFKATKDDSIRSNKLEIVVYP